MANGTVKVSQVDVLTTSGTGTISIVPPATNTNRTLTLPDQTATLATLTTPSFATTIGVGAATASASGAGISFPATQSASTDANTLDDYEEGTWTPSQGAGLTVVGSFSSSGRYTKIGRVVNLEGIVSASTSVALSTTSTILCGNLPFTASTSFQGLGLTNNAANDKSTTIQTYSTSLYGTGTQAATSTIFFSVTYKTT